MLSRPTPSPMLYVSDAANEVLQPRQQALEQQPAMNPMLIVYLLVALYSALPLAAADVNVLRGLAPLDEHHWWESGEYFMLLDQEILYLSHEHRLLPYRGLVNVLHSRRSQAQKHILGGLSCTDLQKCLHPDGDLKDYANFGPLIGQTSTRTVRTTI